MLHKYCRLLFFPCKIGDFKIAGFVCLPSLLRPIFGNFFNYTLNTNWMAVHVLQSVLKKKNEISINTLIFI